MFKNLIKVTILSMRKRIIKLSSTSVGITLNPTLLELLGINPKEASSYTLDISYENNSLILKNPVKNKEKKD